jgi:hypothetical protein
VLCSALDRHRQQAPARCWECCSIIRSRHDKLAGNRAQTNLVRELVDLVAHNLKVR